MPRERDRRLVGELDRAPHQPRSASWTSAETRFPSARPPAFAIAAFMTAPIACGTVGARLGDGRGDDLLELVVGQLGGQVGLDDHGLALLAVGELRAAAVAEGARGLEPALALAAQHRELVAVALLGRLLELGEHQPQRRRPAPSRPPSWRW